MSTGEECHKSTCRSPRALNTARTKNGQMLVWISLWDYLDLRMVNDGILTVVGPCNENGTLSTREADHYCFRDSTGLLDQCWTFYMEYHVPSLVIGIPRFVSKFWQGLWSLLDTKLRMSSAYHPQTDGQTEAMNRVVEMVLRSVMHESREYDHWEK